MDHPKNMTCAFFLAANSKDGFVSFFDSAMTEMPGRDTYLVKSGPGCGKATAIGRLAGGLYAGGAPGKVITQETLREVFRIEADITHDAAHNCPYFIPMRILNGTAGESPTDTKM